MNYRLSELEVARDTGEHRHSQILGQAHMPCLLRQLWWRLAVPVKGQTMMFPSAAVGRLGAGDSLIRAYCGDSGVGGSGYVPVISLSCWVTLVR